MVATRLWPGLVSACAQALLSSPANILPDERLYRTTNSALSPSSRISRGSFTCSGRFGNQALRQGRAQGGERYAQKRDGNRLLSRQQTWPLPLDNDFVCLPNLGDNYLLSLPMQMEHAQIVLLLGHIPNVIVFTPMLRGSLCSILRHHIMDRLLELSFRVNSLADDRSHVHDILIQKSRLGKGYIVHLVSKSMAVS